jgi:hypothetical protein
VTASAPVGTSTLSGQGTLTVCPASAVTHFGLFARGTVVTGFATPVVVEALNAANRVVPGYTGTVSLTSSDSAAKGTSAPTATTAALPLGYTFTLGDGGTHQFQVNFGTTGRQALTATDSTTTPGTSLTGSLNLAVFSQPLLRPHDWIWAL